MLNKSEIKQLIDKGKLVENYINLDKQLTPNGFDLTVEKIFEMTIEEGRASAHQQLPFTTEPSRYLHPAISQDDSILVFSSDRIPSSGGLDLFVSRKTGSGWSAPAWWL